ncbi:MAG: hypothetical protein C0408_06120 [Odoribacter sp.]|nr:hypothetical protein [Odoribacter sp.]
MKKELFILTTLSLFILSIQGQTVTNYSYQLDNGINVKAERCWNHVWVQQTYEAIAAGNQATPLGMNIRTLGDLILSGSTIKLLSAGKEVKMQGIAPGTYDLKVTSKLSGKPGTLSFVAPDIVIKPKTKTSVSVTLYDYQIIIAETAGTFKGLSSYESTVNSYKGSADQNPIRGAISFYTKGKHDAKITPDETASETKGKIKTGTYDVLLTIGISGQKHEVWLENFVMKPDISYKIGINLNGGVIVYTGGNKEVKAMHLYPVGTAARQSEKPAPDKTREIISYENIILTNACPPRQYDVLLNFGKGTKYEWRKNIIIQSGVRTEVK